MLFIRKTLTGGWWRVVVMDEMGVEDAPQIYSVLAKATRRFLRAEIRSLGFSLWILCTKLLGNYGPRGECVSIPQFSMLTDRN